jgi:hypothetical protein
MPPIKQLVKPEELNAGTITQLFIEALAAAKPRDSLLDIGQFVIDKLKERGIVV